MRLVTVTLNIFLFIKTSSLFFLSDPMWHIKAVLFLKDVSQIEKSPDSPRHLYLPDRHQFILTRDGESLESFWDALDSVHLLILGQATVYSIHYVHFNHIWQCQSMHISTFPSNTLPFCAVLCTLWAGHASHIFPLKQPYFYTHVQSL